MIIWPSNDILYEFVNSTSHMRVFTMIMIIKITVFQYFGLKELLVLSMNLSLHMLSTDSDTSRFLSH